MGQIIQAVVFQFNDERVMLSMPPDFDALVDTKEIAANDSSHIRIVNTVF